LTTNWFFYKIKARPKSLLSFVPPRVWLWYVPPASGPKVQAMPVSAAPSADPPANQEWRYYYYAGAQRVAMRLRHNSTNNVYYFVGDHLGSTSITTNANGAKVGELRYAAYGETRFSDGTTPTTLLYTGQRSEDSVGLYTQFGIKDILQTVINLR
jgi:hypothetical protein